MAEVIIGKLKGYITKGCDNLYWWTNRGGNNEEPFRILGVNKVDYCFDVLGYRPEDGGFPECRTEEDVIKVCKKLHIDVSEKLGLSNHGYKVGDWVIIKFSSQNFNGYMNELVGKKVQITHLSSIGLHDCTIDFEGSGKWQWKLSQGHFKKCDPPTTDAPETFKLGSTYLFYSPSGYLEGTVRGDGSGWFWDSRGSNSAPFSHYETTRYKVQERILGYTTGFGEFPYCKTREDLFTFCEKINEERKAFYAEVPTKEVTEEEEEEVFVVTLEEDHCVPGITFYSPKRGKICTEYDQSGDGTWYFKTIPDFDVFGECGLDPETVQRKLLGYSEIIHTTLYCKSKLDLNKLCEHIHDLRKNYFRLQAEAELESTLDQFRPTSKSSALSTPILIKVCKI